MTTPGSQANQNSFISTLSSAANGIANLSREIGSSLGRAFGSFVESITPSVEDLQLPQTESDASSQASSRDLSQRSVRTHSSQRVAKATGKTSKFSQYVYDAAKKVKDKYLAEYEKPIDTATLRRDTEITLKRALKSEILPEVIGDKFKSHSDRDQNEAVDDFYERIFKPLVQNLHA